MKAAETIEKENREFEAKIEDFYDSSKDSLVNLKDDTDKQTSRPSKVTPLKPPNLAELFKHQELLSEINSKMQSKRNELSPNKDFKIPIIQNREAPESPAQSELPITELLENDYKTTIKNDSMIENSSYTY
jgi:hypothetical protein